MTNTKQEEIIKDSITPAAVIAGPGTGKTYTIVQKVVELVKNHNIPANKILLTTFTKKAARELNERIVTEFNKEGINTDLKDLKIGNFHNLAISYLEEYRSLERGFFKPRIIDKDFEGYFLSSNMEIFYQIDGFIERFGKNNEYQVMEIFETITNNLIDVKRLDSSNNPDEVLSAKIYKTYLNLLRENNFINFQLILKDFYDLLNDPKYGDRIRSNIEFIIIDEYQDTNFIQQEIAFSLLKNNNIMVFGDDDQSLYSFRGADPRNLTDFSDICLEKLGSPAKIYHLDINYRSNQAIIDLSKEFMDVDLFSYKESKNLKSISEDTNQNTIVRARANNFDNLLKIIKILNKEISLNQIAFLFPTLNNDYPKSLEKYLENAGIPVINHGISSFFERDEIRMMIFIFVKLFSSYPDNLGYEANLSAEELKAKSYRRYLASLFDDKRFNDRDLTDLIASLSNENYSLSEIFYRALELPFFENILTQKLGDLKTDRMQKNLASLSQKIADYEEITNIDNPSYYRNFVEKYLYYFYKTNSIKEYDELDRSYDAINLMTIHNSKGLEFEVVFVSGLKDKPRDNSKKLLEEYANKTSDINDKYKDFYRKYYTAFTRAKNLLVMLDNSEDEILYNFSQNLPDGSVLSSIDFKMKDNKKDKPIFAYTTDIAVYESCPLKYKYLTKLDFRVATSDSLLFGSRVHQIAQEISNNKVDGYDNLDLDKIYEIDPNFKEPIENFINKDFNVKDAEANYKLDRDFYILHGDIDVILADDSILDIKTGSYNTDTLLKYQKQLITYKYLRLGNGEPVGDLYLYFIENDELIKVPDVLFDMDDIDKIALDIVDENIYEKTDDINQCRHCPMKYYCKRY